MERLRNLNMGQKLKSLLMLQSRSFIIKVIIYAILLTLIVLTAIFVYGKSTLRERDCDALEYMYPDFPSLGSISSSDFLLRDYYIKTAANCCNPGNLDNAYVDLCALQNAIKQGYRCLDFAVFSINDKPVIASSGSASFKVKESYNSIPFAEAMLAVNNYAFSSATCPNFSDPLIVYLRIKSNNDRILAPMANAITENLGSHLLGQGYGSEYNGRNLGSLPLSVFKNKAIIIVDKSNGIFEESPLDELVNMASNTPFMRSMTFENVKTSHDTQELTNFNKKNMSIVIPDEKLGLNNPSAALCMQYGCQLIGMYPQLKNDNLDFYNDKFNSAGSAFVLKEKRLRYTPTTVTVPTPPSKELSYAPRVAKTDYYNFTI